jgi:hypothetical protein
VCKANKYSVRKFWDNEELQTIFNLPFSDEAFQQLNDIQAMMQQLHLNELNDKWKFSGHDFSSSRAYSNLV